MVLGEIDKLRLKKASLSDSMMITVESAKRKMNHHGDANFQLVNTHRQVLTILQLPTESIIAISPSVLRDLENNDAISEIVIASYLNKAHWTWRIGEIILKLSIAGFYSYISTTGFIFATVSPLTLIPTAVLFVTGLVLLALWKKSVPNIQDIYGEHASEASQLLLAGVDVSVLEKDNNVENVDSKPNIPLKRFLGICIAVGLIIAIVSLPLFLRMLEMGSIDSEMLMMFIVMMVVFIVGLPFILFIVLTIGYMLIRMRTIMNEQASRTAIEGSTPHDIDQIIRETLVLDNIAVHWMDDESGEKYISVIKTKGKASAKPYFNVHPSLVKMLDYPIELACYLISRITEKQLYSKAQKLYFLATGPIYILLILGFIDTITHIDQILKLFSYMGLGVLIGVPPYLIVYRWYKKKRVTNDLNLYKTHPEFLTVLRKLVEEKYSPAVEGESYEKRFNRLLEKLHKSKEM